MARTPNKDLPSVELSECCHATIGYDAWVDSNGEICGGPYDHNICINCGMEDPAVMGRPDVAPTTLAREMLSMLSAIGSDRAK